MKIDLTAHRIRGLAMRLNEWSARPQAAAVAFGMDDRGGRATVG
jgi:hypothetical protein